MSHRVLYLIGSGALGGTERQLAELIGQLRPSGWEAGIVFLLEGGPIEQELASQGFPTWMPSARRPHVDGGRVRRHLATVASIMRAAVTVRRAVRQFQPDVVHALLPTSIWLGLSVVSGRRTRKVAGIRGFTPPLLGPLRLAYTRQLRRAAAVVCNAAHLADEMKQVYGVHSDRVTVIPNGVALPSHLSDPAGEPPVGVMVANFHAYKGHDVLMQALTEVDRRVSVRLCGVGAQRDAVIDLAARLGVGERVTFVEPPAAVWDELRVAQFVVHPSLTEGFPNAVLEAMASGLPVVASDVGGTSQLIEDGLTGLLVPPGHPGALAAAINRLVQDPDLRGQMGVAAHRRATGFSWELCSSAHADLYGGLMRR
jgi:glycosyltransferase involved in cell wall biosynthesis